MPLVTRAYRADNLADATSLLYGYAILPAETRKRKVEQRVESFAKGSIHKDFPVAVIEKA
jgi:hypothetical protein